jgi:hypothetical protein
LEPSAARQFIVNHRSFEKGAFRKGTFHTLFGTPIVYRSGWVRRG